MNFVISFYFVVIFDIALLALVARIANRLPGADTPGGKLAAGIAAFVGFSAGMIVFGGLVGLLLQWATVDVAALVNAWDEHRGGLTGLAAPVSVFLLILAVSVIAAQLAWGLSVRISRGRRRSPAKA